jgi:hypothetical protein
MSEVDKHGQLQASAPAPALQPSDLVWAKVNGWPWWPARMLSTVGHENIALFLVDNTVARVPSTLPQFDQHYHRFLTAAYTNKVSAQCRTCTGWHPLRAKVGCALVTHCIAAETFPSCGGRTSVADRDMPEPRTAIV